jgi:hypothetical protein
MSDNPLLMLDLDEETFSHFPCYEGKVPAGYWGNWLGVFTKANVWAVNEDIMKIYNQTREERFEYPLKDEHILDWYALLKAIINAKEKFTMASIGSGWGRWLSAGAFASKYCNKDYYLIGVEAEPDHFNWLRYHLEDNRISSDRYRLFNAAASNYCGFCWFYVGKPSNWYGQSVVPDSMVTQKGSQSVGSKVSFNNELIQRVACIDLKEVIGSDYIDYMMLDIQGSEEIFLTEYPDIIQNKIKMINVGTHSHGIEKNLYKFFIDLGWNCLFNIPMNTRVEFNIMKKSLTNISFKTKPIQFGDGVQIWINEKPNPLH